MRLRNRFLLVGLGIIIFLIATPLLILYARGFKYEFSSGRIIKTGALVVRTEPDKSSIYIDNELAAGKSPLNIRFLLPKDYDIRLEKDGYQSWTKRLTVRSQLVTWANYNRQFVTLFYQQPQVKQTMPVVASNISADGKQIAYISNGDSGGLIQVDSQNNSVFPIPTGFNPANLSAQFSWQNGSKTYDLLSQLAQAHKDSLARLTKAEKIIGNGDYLVFTINNDLYSLNRAGQINLLDRSILDFTLESDQIWYLQKNSIKNFNLSDNQTQIIYKDLPVSQTGAIVRSENQIYVILDHTLYLLNGSLEKIYSNATFARAIDNGKILTGNDNEVVQYNPDSGDSELILRSSTPIVRPILNDTTGYLFFQNEGKIKAVELDGRDHRNIYTLADAARDFTIDSTGQLLYILSNQDIRTVQIR